MNNSIKDKVLIVTNLTKSFNQNKVLDNINFSVNKGEFVTVIGRSGCGKTTLIRCLNCLEIPDEGKLVCDDVSISFDRELIKDKKFFLTNSIKDFQKKDLADYFEPEMKKNIFGLRKKIGFMFQDLNLFPHLNVLKNVTIALEKVKLISTQEAEVIAIEILKKVGLAKYIDRMPYQLSAGQQQRTAVARALAINPAIMLYDEPTSALDPKLVLEVIAIIKDLSSEGMTQLVVTHSLQIAKNYSHYVMFMEKGKIIENGTPEQIFNNPTDLRTKEYVNILE